jgi:hypothetical protein
LSCVFLGFLHNGAMARAPIKDEFEKLPISRQRKYQLRKQRDGRCTECGAPSAGSSRCLKHLVKARERQRKKKGTRKRYLTLSYRLEQMARKTGKKSVAQKKRVAAPKARKKAKSK